MSGSGEGSGSNSHEHHRPRRRVSWRTVVTWVVLGVAAVLGVGAAGGLLTLLVPCDRGLECLGYPIYGAAIGALAGLLGVGALAARRLGVGWWWGPVGVLVVGAAVALTAWFVVDLRRDRAELAVVESIGLPLHAPTGRTDLEIASVRPDPEEGQVTYSVARREQSPHHLTVRTAPAGELGCEVGRGVEACERVDDTTVVARTARDLRVHRALGETDVVLGAWSGSTLRGWTESELVELAHQLEPVDAWRLVRRATGE